MSSAPQQRYRVIERLASGGMAEVYLAESAGIEGFKKQVAIKRVLPHLSEKKRFIAMFLDEARLSAHLTHSNVAQVFDIGVGDNAYFIVMEYVNGADLKAIIDFMKKDGRAFPPEAAVFIAAKICEGLAYAHELTSSDGKPLAIVHRDMSPPNVLLTKYGEVKIVDFGLAKATSQLEKSEAGIIKGKFSYLSPEAALGDEVDHRTDIFAVGIILWEMLAGKRLFLGETDFQTVKLVQQAKIPQLSPENPAVPPKLDKIMARALARDPVERYATARDLGRALTTFLYELGRPVSAFDVSELVVGAMKVRKKVKPDGGVIIDRLIEEALVEFKSLQEVERSGLRESQPEPAKSGGAFEDIMGWASEIGLGSTQPSDKSATPWGDPGGEKAKPAESPAKESLLDVFDDEDRKAAAPPKPAAKVIVDELSGSELLSTPDIEPVKMSVEVKEPAAAKEPETAKEPEAAKEPAAAKEPETAKEPAKEPAKESEPAEASATATAKGSEPAKEAAPAKEPTSTKALKRVKDAASEAKPVSKKSAGQKQKGASTKLATKRDELSPVAASESGSALKVLLVAAAIAVILMGAWLGGLFGGNP